MIFFLSFFRKYLPFSLEIVGKRPSGFVVTLTEWYVLISFAHRLRTIAEPCINLHLMVKGHYVVTLCKRG